MKPKSIHVHIGDAQDMGKRFAAAWKTAAKGKPIARDHLTFLSLEAFMATMSPKRLALIRHLKVEGPMSVRKLSGGLKRDYKSVHRDVAVLETAGLIERRARDAIAVGWDRLHTELDLAA